MATDLVTVHFKGVDGVFLVRLRHHDAIMACQAHPHEWAVDPKKFAEPLPGFTPARGNGGGYGRVLGACVRVE
jgi:hypothetical protein